MSTYDWQKQEGELATSVLSQLMNEQTGRQRRAYSHEWERHERLAEILMSGPPAARNLIEAIAALNVPFARPEMPSRNRPADTAFNHQMNLVQDSLANRLTFRFPPYDVPWTDFQPYDRWGTAAHGPSVDLNGYMSLDLSETYVDRPIAYGGWMRDAAGIGTWFKPKSTSTYVRVSPLLDYEYSWGDDSNLQVAHNAGDIAVLVQHYLGPGRFETVLDSRNPLWRDGTSWYQVHGDSGSGRWVDSHYFWASSDEWYLVWVWCNSAIDFATKTTFGSSKAFNWLVSHLRWLVFEQWA